MLFNHTRFWCAIYAFILFNIHLYYSIVAIQENESQLAILAGLSPLYIIQMVLMIALRRVELDRIAQPIEDE